MEFRPDTAQFREFRAASRLCVRQSCIQLDFGSCTQFTAYNVEVTQLVQRSTKSDQGEAQQADSSETQDEDVAADLVVPGSICAILASQGTDNFYLVHISETFEAQHKVRDPYDNVIPAGVPAIEVHYLEKYSKNPMKGTLYMKWTVSILSLYFKATLYSAILYRMMIFPVRVTSLTALLMLMASLTNWII